MNLCQSRVISWFRGFQFRNFGGGVWGPGEFPNFAIHKKNCHCELNRPDPSQDGARHIQSFVGMVDGGLAERVEAI